MASQGDIAFTYDDLDELWILLLGPYADATAAYYNGNYRKSLQQAQKDKHAWILEGVGFKPGRRIMDIGCGWGPMLNTIRQKDGRGVGITLSPKQVETCRQHGLEVYLLDWKDLNPDEFGQFDAVVSLGAMEHFCSVDEYVQRRQEDIYRAFFKLCSDLMPHRGMLYLQTMTWGSCMPWGDQELTADNVYDYSSLTAPKRSDERFLAYIRYLFPGSWLPKNKDQLVRLAKPYFELVSASDGRLDYIQTLTEWDKAWHHPKPGKWRAKLKLLPNYLFKGREYRAKMKALDENALRELFIRNIFGHQRLFFRKKSVE